MSDTLTFFLDGEVTVEDFADAVNRFQELVAALSADLTQGGLEWLVTSLEATSASMTASGRGQPEGVDLVVRAYDTVGSALQHRRRVPYSPRVVRAAEALASLANGRIKAVILQTENEDHLVRAATHGDVAERRATERIEPVAQAYGAVMGRVETIARRGGLRFTLYDRVFDKAVSCFLRPGSEHIMRNLWGRMALVEGLVTRDPSSGRPLSVRQVSKAGAIEEGKADDWRRACGVLPHDPDRLPETIVRAYRDA